MIPAQAVPHPVGLPAGSTIYMDPEPTVALNNKEAMLSGQEEEEEARILAVLSAAVAAQSARIWQVRILKFDSFPLNITK